MSKPVERIVRILCHVFLAAICACLPTQARCETPCQRLLSEAQQLLARREASQASKTLQAAVSKCPANSEVYNLLGISYEALGDSTKAQAAFRQAIRLAPNLAGLHTNLAISLTRTGQQEAALSEFRRALALDPFNAKANAHLGAYYLSKHEYKLASESFVRGKVERTNDLGLLLAVAEAYLGAGQKAGAERVARRLVQLGGADPRVRFSLGLLLARNGEFESAAENFAAIPASERDFAVYFNLGQAYSRLGRFEDARRAYFHAIDLDPTSADVYAAVGADYIAGNDIRRAVPWLRRAHQMAPSQPDILLQFISALIQTGFYDTAKNLLDERLATDTDNAKLYALQGDLLFKTKSLERALESYQKAISLQADQGNLYAASGRVLMALNRQDEAEAAFRQALKLNPDHVEANAQLGHLLVTELKYQDAVPYLTRALHTNPSYGRAKYDLSRAYLGEGKLREACSLVEQLVHADPENPQYHFDLARMYRKEEKTTLAENEMRVYQELQRKRKNQLRFPSPPVYPD